MYFLQVGNMKWLFRWMFHNELSEEYDKGWKDGVNQHRFEPKTAEHGYIEYREYWGEEE